MTPIAAVVMPVAVVIATAAWRARGHHRARIELREHLDLLSAAKQAGLTEEKLRPIEQAVARRQNKWELWEMAPFRWAQRIFVTTVGLLYLLFLALWSVDRFAWHKLNSSVPGLVAYTLWTSIMLALVWVIRTLAYAHRNGNQLLAWVLGTLNGLLDSIEIHLTRSPAEQPSVSDHEQR